MSKNIWALPGDKLKQTISHAGELVFIGGAGDFDDTGTIRNPDSIQDQIIGSLENISASLETEGCELNDVARFKVYYVPDSKLDEWALLACVQNYMPDSPAPVISMHPVFQLPFDNQKIQIQVIATEGWRQALDLQIVSDKVPESAAPNFNHPEITLGLRAKELVVVSGLTAQADWKLTSDDPIQQSHDMMNRVSDVLKSLGCTLQDAVKKEGYYFGTTSQQWEDMAKVRATYWHEPGPVATTVPCSDLFPEGACTKVEVIGMRETWNGFNKYIPRNDTWPRRIWDWQVELPYRQAIMLRDTIWLGGQVPKEPNSNSGKTMLPYQLLPQVRYTMGLISTLLEGFGVQTSQLAMLVCYYTASDEPNQAHQVINAMAECMQGPLPPITLIPQSHMHTEDAMVEIWGVARAGKNRY